MDNYTEQQKRRIAELYKSDEDIEKGYSHFAPSNSYSERKKIKGVTASMSKESHHVHEHRSGHGGEGSKGGKVIGHTKNGNPIYDQANHPHHAGFSASEHREAAIIHHEHQQSKGGEGHADYQYHQDAKMHHKKMMEHIKAHPREEIGKTRSGKSVNADHDNYKGSYGHYSSEDHKDAAREHSNMAEKVKGYHRNKHKELANYHEAESKK